MRLGVTFPHNDIGTDPAAIRDFAQAVEDLGYHHLVAYDHVLGAAAERYGPGDLKGSYREKDLFHEPFVLFGFLAGVTRKLEFAPSVLILPQRQTALVAKQAAELDVLSGGRLRIGVGTGWNFVEYEALGVPFAERGQRQEEQIQVLRELWTRPVVDFRGRYHTITSAGINPLPIQRPIPIWLGGMAEPVLRRISRLADGWIPQFPSLDPTLAPGLPRNREDPATVIARVRRYTKEAGRDPAQLGIEGRIVYAGGREQDWIDTYDRWAAMGATHLSVVTRRAGLAGVDAHLDAIRRVKLVLDARRA